MCLFSSQFCLYNKNFLSLGFVTLLTTFQLLINVLVVCFFCGQRLSYDTELWHHFACNLELNGIGKGSSEREGVTLVLGRKEREGKNVILAAYTE